AFFLSRAGRRSAPAQVPDDGREPTPDHPLRIERHRILEFLEARVIHGLAIGLVAHRAGGIDDPREHHHLVVLQLHGAREGSHFPPRRLVRDAFHVGQGAVFLPDLLAQRSHPAVVVELVLLHRDHESVDIGHVRLLVLASYPLHRSPTASPAGYAAGTLGTSPSRAAACSSCTAEPAPSFCRSEDWWLATVLGVSPRLCAISLTDL